MYRTGRAERAAQILYDCTPMCQPSCCWSNSYTCQMRSLRSLVHHPGANGQKGIMHPTTIAVVTGNFFILERALSARNHPESAERYFRIAFPRSCQIAAVLLVGVVVSILNTPDLRAQLRAPQGQSDDQKHGQTVQAAMSPDIVTVPDGTPLTLKFAKDLSSTTAKGGDKVRKANPYTCHIH